MANFKFKRIHSFLDKYSVFATKVTSSQHTIA